MNKELIEEVLYLIGGSYLPIIIWGMNASYSLIPPHLIDIDIFLGWIIPETKPLPLIV